MASEALVQLAPIRNSTLIIQLLLITSSATHDRCFHIFSFSTVANSEESIGRSPFVHLFAKPIHSWFKSKCLQTLRTFKAKVV